MKTLIHDVNLFLCRALPDRSHRFLWLALFTVAVPFTLWVRFYDWGNPLLEPHPMRQTMTLVQTLGFFEGKAQFPAAMDKDGLWNLVFAFPLQQYLASKLMMMGLSAEFSLRAISMTAHFAGIVVWTCFLGTFLGTAVALWAALLLWISPFQTFFSRTSIADNLFMFFALWMIFLTVKICRNGEKRNLHMGALFLCGTLAATIKTNLWLFPALALCLYVLWEFLRKRLTAKDFSLLAAIFLAQAVIAFSWTQYAMKMRGEDGAVPQFSWYFGEWHLRLQWAYWSPILNTIRNIYHDWMIIPALVAFTDKKQRSMVWVLTLIPVLNTLLFFNVHSVHDYYFIGCAPFLLTLPAIGLVRMGKLANPTKSLLLTGMLLILCYRAVKLPYTFTTVFHDYRKEAKLFQAVEKLTEPNEAVLWPTEMGWGYWNFWPALAYTKRKLINESSEKPTAYVMPTQVDFEKYPLAPPFWVEGSSPHLWVVRALSEASPLDRPKHLAGLLEESSNARGFSEEWDLCQTREPVLVKLPQAGAWVRIQTQVGEIFLPKPKTLSLPYEGPFGCHYRIHLTD